MLKSCRSVMDLCRLYAFGPGMPLCGFLEALAACWRGSYSRDIVMLLLSETVGVNAGDFSFKIHSFYETTQDCEQMEGSQKCKNKPLFVGEEAALLSKQVKTTTEVIWIICFDWKFQTQTCSAKMLTQ